MSNPVSVLIVDDSALMRNVISKIIEATPGLVVADRAMNGSFALQKIPRCDPDVIVLDLEMPEMNGIEFLRERVKQGISVPVVILSSLARKGAEITMEALALGASDFILKPNAEQANIKVIGEHLSQMLYAYGAQYKRQKEEALLKKGIEKPLKPELKKPELQAKAEPLRAPGPMEIIAIGISTGGPNALREVFSSLDPELAQPIVVVQHMPAGFTFEFARSLDRVCPLEVKEAEDGDIIKPGRILIAPGDKHLEVEKRTLASIARLSSEAQVNGHRPSAGVLFESIAKAYGNRAMGIIMTGMGRDGAKEIGEIYREGGITLGQDESSCVVYGMPKVAHELGNITMQVGLHSMAETISKLAREHK